MINFLMFGGIFLIFLGLPASIVTTIVFKVKKKKALIPATCITASIFLGFIFICIGGYLYGQTNEYKESMDKKEKSELEQLKEETQNQEEYIKDLEKRLEDAEKEEDNPVESTVVEQESITEPTSTTVLEETQEPEYDFTYRDMTVKYLSHEIMVDSVDQTVLVVYYEFTNNSRENKTFDYSFSDTCFQNGIEVEHSYWHANEESKNSGKEIKSGTTITVASSFVLGDSRDKVEIEITPWVSFTEKALLELELELE